MMNDDNLLNSVSSCLLKLEDAGPTASHQEASGGIEPSVWRLLFVHFHVSSLDTSQLAVDPALVVAQSAHSAQTASLSQPMETLIVLSTPVTSVREEIAPDTLIVLESDSQRHMAASRIQKQFRRHSSGGEPR